ncbi:hypothetical protein VTN00DRAFT_4420 [Thermoascus crustaceus]|uniref:uncharacterized protein n=1 Tax=Thermoascus crustaceus TaxID=5088 RepID=UPI003741ED13
MTDRLPIATLLPSTIAGQLPSHSVREQREDPSPVALRGGPAAPDAVRSLRFPAAKEPSSQSQHLTSFGGLREET